MNLKHEMFWNYNSISDILSLKIMNLKHEMFWNFINFLAPLLALVMNLKHEMFWNENPNGKTTSFTAWTLNMKCFEINLSLDVFYNHFLWTLNMKCFEILNYQHKYHYVLMNLKHEMFWNKLTSIPNVSILSHEP